jgi:hypothetical protein
MSRIIWILDIVAADKSKDCQRAFSTLVDDGFLTNEHRIEELVRAMQGIGVPCSR